MISQVMVCPEEFYTDASDEEDVQVYRVYEQQRARVSPENILSILADYIQSAECGSIRDYVEQTLAGGEPSQDWMPVPTALNIGQELVRVIREAIAGQVAMRMACA